MRPIAIAATAAALATLSACAANDTVASSALAAGSPAAATAAAAPTNAAAYVAEAARSDMYEIQSSQLAQSKATSAAVKDFAANMIRDHTTSTQMITAAVTQSGMSPPPPPPLDARRQGMLDQLRGASGAEFDRLYVQQQTMAHQEALALHQAYAANGDKAPLRGAAGQIVPVVQHHLHMLQGMGR